MANTYTSVITKPAEMLPGRGFQIVLIAQGAGVPDVTDTYVTNGQTFDALDLKRKSIALLDRLNTNDAFIKQIQSIAGQPVDVSPIITPKPDDPPAPTPNEVALKAFALLIADWSVETRLLRGGLTTEESVEAARARMQAAYDGAKDPALAALFRVEYSQQIR